MRHTCCFLLASSLLALAASVFAAGCSVDCHTTLTCGEAPPLGTGGAGGLGGSGGGGAGACVPSEVEGPVEDTCGVFVSKAGKDTNAGSKGSPVATIAKALDLAAQAKKPVYACAEVFSEAVVVPEGSVVYGGLDCGAGWAYVAGTSSKRTKIAPPAGEIPLKLIQGGSGPTRLTDVIAEAAAGIASAGGGSSVAAIVDGVTAVIERCDFIARDGAAGPPGETPSESVGPTDKNDAAIAGNAGKNACMGGGMGNLGGVAKSNALCASSIGGAGGKGLDALGEKGEDGQPIPMPNPDSYGVGGEGSTGAGCLTGESGNVGATGESGAGAGLLDLGSIGLSGYTGVVGAPGKDGAVGQGGGGGGGSKGKVDCFGASGGSGGAGGCGGRGGGGGKAGGSSIALISLGASLTFTNVALKAGSGGTGGDGGTGQQGGVGGAGGPGGVPGSSGAGTLSACAGGAGGPGGFGGQGGGGRGGHSTGIAYMGSAPPTSGVTITIAMQGKGGVGASPSGTGADGQAANTIAFK